jgi:isoamylase
LGLPNDERRITNDETEEELVMSANLGAHYNQKTQEVNFCIFSANATRITLFFYAAPLGEEAVREQPLLRQQNLWVITLPMAELRQAGLNFDYLYYGYRAWGPNWEYQDAWRPGSELGLISDVDAAGNRFNPNKLLIDPYATELSHDPQVDRLYLDPNAYVPDYYGGEYRSLDTGKIAPKSILLLNQRRPAFGRKPQRHLKDDVIYEVNLRGLTMNDPGISPEERGTYRGAGCKAAYLKELGVTAVEFLPVQEFADEQNDDGDPRGDNYWGYMTVNYFAPNRRYAMDRSPGGPTREFQAMVKAFHDVGIKVFLDVVYNHTGEGLLRRRAAQESPEATTVWEESFSRRSDSLQDYRQACYLSLTGLDNSSYYFLRDGNRRYEDRGGCGGNLNYDNIVVQNLILDSLLYWVKKMGVDGFRFDLAPVLSVTGADGDYRANSATPFFTKISQALPSRGIAFPEGVDLIAEPWGDESPIDWSDKFPPDWAVWNKHYRDIVKTALNKYGVGPWRVGDLAQAGSGSAQFIGARPWNSINYLVSHDDCNSLRNLFTYNSYYHLTEGVIRTDQISWDQNGDPEAQLKAIRNAFVLLLVVAGTPMFAGGDELGRTISPHSAGVGRMNLVAIDRPEVYLDFNVYRQWQGLVEAGDTKAADHLVATNDHLYTFVFVKNLLEFRRQHECLRPESYFTGTVDSANGLADLGWYRADGAVMTTTDWENGDFLAWRLNARNELTPKRIARVESIYVAYNRSPRDLMVILPPNVAGNKWYRVLDTDNTGGWMTDHRNFDGGRTQLGREYRLHGRSILVLVEK